MKNLIMCINEGDEKINNEGEHEEEVAHMPHIRNLIMKLYSIFRKIKRMLNNKFDLPSEAAGR